MKRIFSFFAVMLLVLTLHAVPAYRGLITVNQPDGTTLKVYNHGDEFFITKPPKMVIWSKKMPKVY